MAGDDLVVFKFLAGASPGYFAFLAFVNLALSICLPILIDSHNKAVANNKRHSPPATPYGLFLGKLAMSLLVLTWAAAFLSTPRSLFKKWVENKYFRRGMKAYFFMEAISFTMGITTLSVEVGRTDKNIAHMNLVLYGVGMFVYIAVLLIGSRLCTGYEVTVLAVIHAASFTFGSQFAQKSDKQLFWLAVFSAVGIFMTIWADYCIPDKLLAEASAEEAVRRAARIYYAEAAHKKRKAIRENTLQILSDELAIRGGYNHPDQPQRVLVHQARQYAKTIYVEAERALNAQAKKAIVEIKKGAWDDFIQELKADQAETLGERQVHEH